LSEDQEERIEIDIDNSGDFDESSDIGEPLEIIREEVVAVVENSDTETSPLSSMEDQQEEEEDEKNEIKTDDSNRYAGEIYEQVRAQSIQLNGLADMVQSLQSQVKQLQETIRLRKHKKTRPVRKKSTSNNRIKTKKKTKRRGSGRSRK